MEMHTIAFDVADAMRGKTVFSLFVDLLIYIFINKIMMCLVIHLPTFQPPVDGARSLASSPVKDFYRR